MNGVISCWLLFANAVKSRDRFFSRFGRLLSTEKRLWPVRALLRTYVYGFRPLGGRSSAPFRSAVPADMLGNVGMTGMWWRRLISTLVPIFQNSAPVPRWIRWLIVTNDLLVDCAKLFTRPVPTLCGMVVGLVEGERPPKIKKLCKSAKLQELLSYLTQGKKSIRNF